MTESKPFSISPYLDIVWRHRRAAAGVLALGLTVTLCLVTLLRDVYVATAAVMIEPPRVASNYISTGSDRIESPTLANQLEGLARQAFTDAWLRDVIVRLGLYHVRQSPQNQDRPLDQLVKYMREHMELVVPPDTIHWEDNHSEEGSPVVLTISFEYSDRYLAQRVAAKLAKRFIDEGQKEKRERVTEATRFLDTQVSRARAGLDQKGEQIRILEQRYQGSLPEDLSASLEQLDRLEDQLRMIDERIAVSPLAVSQVGTELTPEQQLASLKLKLNHLRAEYSEEYPDIMELKDEIASLKTQIAAEAKDTKETHVTNDDPSPYKGHLEQEAAGINQKIQLLQQNIALVPEHGQAMAALSRDYDALSADYHQLLQKQMAAELRQTLDKRQQDEHLRLLNPVSLPKAPKAPDRLAIAALGILFSLVGALGVPFGLFFTDTSYKTPEELESDYGIRVVGAIPIVDEDKEQRQATIQALVFSSASVLLVAGSLLAYAEWFRS